MVDGFDDDSDAFGHKFRVQSVDVINDQVGHTTGKSVTGKRGDVQPDTIARDAHVAGIWFRVVHAMSEFPPEAEPVAIEVLGLSGARYMEKRDR